MSLKQSLKLYKDSLGKERLKVKEEARQKVEIGQLRVLFWMPEEYVLVYNIDENIAHCVPFTIWCSLTTVPLRIYVNDKPLAPLPFVVYINSEVLEQESLPITVLKKEIIEKVLASIKKAPVWSAKKEKREFIKLVWSRYQDLVLASILFNCSQKEEQNHLTKSNFGI